MSVVASAVLALAVPLWDREPIPLGSATVVAATTAQPITLHTFRPAGYDPARGPLVFSFHGVLRNADTYRDSAKPLADALGGLAVAPEFDKRRFPNRAYQSGNLLAADGTANPPAQWTWNRVPELADSVRRRAGRPGQPLILVGHSGGGQFLTRLAGFTDPKAVRVVAANPGSLLFPTRDLPYPYGFGKLPDHLSDDAAIKAYLTRPLTLYLGTEDTKQDENLDVSATAMKQGGCRYERGKAAYKLASEVAAARGWKLAWRLVEAPGVGHDGAAMFAHPACRRAMSPD